MDQVFLHSRLLHSSKKAKYGYLGARNNLPTLVNHTNPTDAPKLNPAALHEAKNGIQEAKRKVIATFS